MVTKKANAIHWEDVKLGAIRTYIHDFDSAKRKFPNGNPEKAFTNYTQIPPAVAFAWIENLVHPYEDWQGHKCAEPIKLSSYFDSMLKYQYDQSMSTTGAAKEYFPNKYAICVSYQEYYSKTVWIYRHDDMFYEATLMQEDCV